MCVCVSAIFLNVRFKYCQCVCLSSGGHSGITAVGAASVNVCVYVNVSVSVSVNVSVDANVSAAVAVTVCTDPTTPTPSVMRCDFDLQLLLDCLFCSRHNKHQFDVFASVAIKDCCCCLLQLVAKAESLPRRIALRQLSFWAFALLCARCSSPPIALFVLLSTFRRLSENCKLSLRAACVAVSFNCDCDAGFKSPQHRRLSSFSYKSVARANARAA